MRHLSLLTVVLALGIAGVASAQPSSYARAVAMVARRQAADDSIAAAGARTILLAHGAATRRAIVLLHGLTDSPGQFEELAHQLHDDGNNVFVPRFPLHGVRGGDVRTLSALTVAELRAFADSVTSAAAGLGDSLVIVGLSMGATVAAWIAQQRAVWRVVMIAPALEPGRVPSAFDRFLVGLADRLPNVTWRSPADPAHPDHEPGFSLRAAAEILELGGSVMRAAAHTAPSARQLVVLVNAHDRTVRESAAESLARDWARHGATVSILEIPGELRLPHNIFDPRFDGTPGYGVLELVRRIIYGEPSSMMVRSLSVR